MRGRAILSGHSCCRLAQTVRRAVRQTGLIAPLSKPVAEACNGEWSSMVRDRNVSSPRELASRMCCNSGRIGSSREIGLRRRFFCCVKRSLPLYTCCRPKSTTSDRRCQKRNVPFGKPFGERQSGFNLQAHIKYSGIGKRVSSSSIASSRRTRSSVALRTEERQRRRCAGERGAMMERDAEGNWSCQDVNGASRILEGERSHFGGGAAHE
jgi:hypothetical protein